MLASFKVIGPVGRVLEQCVPAYRNMASIKNINVNTRHLKKGDPLPPYNGTLRVYNMRYCPYAQRTILALNAKQIPYEVVNIDLMNKPEWLGQKSAFLKVPALEIADGVSIYESLVTVEYLDEAYPQRPLMSKDPFTKAMDKIIIEAITPVHTLFYKLVKFPDTITEDNVTAFNKALDFLQEQLKSRGTKYLGGNQPGFVDYMIWPWFERILPLRKTNDHVKISEDKYKLLLDYFESLRQDPAINQYLVPDDIMANFLSAYGKGEAPNYDQMLQE